jgi:hypothetical protein
VREKEFSNSLLESVLKILFPHPSLRDTFSQREKEQDTERFLKALSQRSVWERVSQSDG